MCDIDAVGRAAEFLEITAGGMERTLSVSGGRIGEWFRAGDSIQEGIDAGLGPAAPYIRTQTALHAERLRAAADTCRTAASALRRHLDVLLEVEVIRARLPSMSDDPVAALRLADAADAREAESSRQVASVLARLAARAPAPLSGLRRADVRAWETGQEIGIGAWTTVLSGVGEAIAGGALLVRDPKEFAERAWEAGTGIAERAVTDPLGLAKDVLDLEGLRNNPARWLGEQAAVVLPAVGGVAKANQAVRAARAGEAAADGATRGGRADGAARGGRASAGRGRAAHRAQPRHRAGAGRLSGIQREVADTGRVYTRTWVREQRRDLRAEVRDAVGRSCEKPPVTAGSGA